MARFDYDKVFGSVVLVLGLLFVFVFLSPFWMVMARLVFEYVFHGGIHDCQIEAINYYFK